MVSGYLLLSYTSLKSIYKSLRPCSLTLLFASNFDPCIFALDTMLVVTISLHAERFIINKKRYHTLRPRIDFRYFDKKLTAFPSDVDFPTALASLVGHATWNGSVAFFKAPWDFGDFGLAS